MRVNPWAVILLISILTVSVFVLDRYVHKNSDLKQQNADLAAELSKITPPQSTVKYPLSEDQILRLQLAQKKAALALKQFDKLAEDIRASNHIPREAIFNQNTLQFFDSESKTDAKK